MSKIIVIEDENAVRENLHELLELEGHTAFSASDGRDGIELIRQHLPDLIICDIQMPKMDGYQVLEALSEDPYTNSIPFIFLTAKTSRSDMRTGMDLGADDYLTKPFTHDEVLEAIASRLKKQSAVAQHYESQMDELRQNMALMLPHELRTPLTIILGYSSLLLEADEAMARAELKEIGGSIFHAGQRLQRLIQRFLLYAELTVDAQGVANAGDTDGNVTTIHTSLISDLAEQKAQEVNRETDLNLELANGLLQVNGPYLLPLLEELFENAFKFSEAGTPVQISGARDNGTFNITITNQGRGMTPEQIAQTGAYTQFERKRYEQQGQGLGLTIARLAAEQLGGTFSIESVPHEYTSTHLTLPVG